LGNNFSHLIPKRKAFLKMTNKYRFLPLVALISLSSCASFYLPTPTPTPILLGKGDANVFISPKDAQLAYAVSDHFGVTLSGHLDKNLHSLFSDTTGTIAKLLDNKLENVESKGSRSIQGGVSFIHRLDHTKSVQVGVIAGTYSPSMMIKVNRGLFKKNTDEDFKYTGTKANLYLNFVHSSKYVDFITTVNMSSIQYNDIVYTEPLVMKELGKMTPDKYPTLKSRYFFIEPSATIQYGFENFKFRLQGFFSQPMQDKVFGKSQTGVSMGLNYQFNVAKKKNMGSKKRPRA
jgi:hypothetical protein